MAIAIYQDTAGRHHWAESTSTTTLANLDRGDWVLFDATPDNPPPPGDPLDNAIAPFFAPGSTSATAAAARAAFLSRGGVALAPPSMQRVTSVAVPTGPRFVDKVGSWLYAVDGPTGDIYRSTDGASWTVVNTTWPGASGWISRLVATADGELLALTETELRKSSGWSANPATATWSASKVTPNGSSVFNGFALDGDGQKFIVAQYNATPADWDQSRYAHISTDAGTTWTQRYDTETLHGIAASDESHLHGVCYDPWADRFYVSEGHGSAGGVYASDDNGLTWTTVPMRVEAGLPGSDTNGPTVIVATDTGLVMGSDNGENGLFGVLRQADPAGERIVRTWRLHTGRDGLVAFAQRGWRDPDTGQVFVTFRAEYNDTPVVLAAGTPSSGGLVYEHPAMPTAGGADRFAAFAKIDATTALVYGEIAGIPYHFTGTLTQPGDNLGQVTATGNTDGGDTNGQASSLAAGRATTTTLNSVAVGQAATANGPATTAVGRNAAANGSSSAAVGYNAVAGEAGSTLGASAGAGAGGVAVGYATRADYGTDGVAVGPVAKAHTNGVAVGARADASGYTNSVALGADTTVTASAQVAVGARDVEVQDATKGLVLRSPDGTRYRVTVANGGSLTAAAV